MGAVQVEDNKHREATPLDYATIYARNQLIPILISRGGNLKIGLNLASKAAAGEFEQFGELPSSQDYAKILELLENIQDD